MFLLFAWFLCNMLGDLQLCWLLYQFCCYYALLSSSGLRWLITVGDHSWPSSELLRTRRALNLVSWVLVRLHPHQHTDFLFHSYSLKLMDRSQFIPHPLKSTFDIPLFYNSYFERCDRVSWEVDAFWHELLCIGISDGSYTSMLRQTIRAISFKSFRL